MGTCIGIVESFRGITGDKTSIMAALTGLLGDSLVPAAAGVLIAITASCGHRYLCARLAGLDMEMHSAALELVNQLAGRH
jgi:biopolymer transport protein ExbB/TolQ